MRATRACFFGIHDDNNEPVFGKFAGCDLLATALASFEAALGAFVFPYVSESFSRRDFGFHHFALKLVVVASRENLGFGHFVAGGMRHPFVIRRIVPHSIADVEEIVFAAEVMDGHAFAEGVGVLDRLVAGSDVAATSVGAGEFFATLFDECSLRWDICRVEIGVTIVGAHDDECFWVLRERVFHLVEQGARKCVVGLWRELWSGLWCGFWCGCWSSGELLNDAQLVSEMFHRARGVCVMKCSDCVVVVKRAVTFHKLVVIFDKIFCVIACIVFGYAESEMLVRVGAATSW